jgi:hypothetical protein
MRYETRAKIWLWPGEAAWHFVTLPKALSARIKRFAGDARSPFGSLRVSVTVGKTTWKTSLFPSREETLLLPIKAEVRRKERIRAGDTVRLTIDLEL